MATSKKTTKKTSEKRHVHAEITNSIIKALEAGTRPWHKPWNATARNNRPMRHNGEYYKGINTLVLWLAAMDKEYNSEYWMTYKQAQEMGAQVRAGEKSTTVVYASTFTPNNDEEEDNPKSIAYLKAYAVFNADQIDNLPEKYRARPITKNDNERIALAEEFFANTASIVQEGHASAAYVPSLDIIMMPALNMFHDSFSFYATLSHEHIHWTGHKSRLDRGFNTNSGSTEYALEELVAEIGAAFICAELGLPSQIEKDHAPYIANWLKVLKDDNRAIFTAASAAQKAADFLLAKQPQNITTEKAA